MSLRRLIQREKTDRQATLSFLSFDMTEPMARARQKVGDYSGQTPLVFFGKHGTLAKIERNRGNPIISISDLLNRPDTPYQVIEHILVHELLHLVVPADQINGKRVSHPPAFCARERLASPDRERVWGWIHGQWGTAIIEDAENECVCLKRGWRKQFAERHRASLFW